MDALILTIFVSAVLVAGFVLLFMWTVRSKTFDHADRLALLPLREEGALNASGRSTNAALASAELRQNVSTPAFTDGTNAEEGNAAGQ